jgi:hypothetical protein
MNITVLEWALIVALATVVIWKSHSSEQLILKVIPCLQEYDTLRQDNKVLVEKLLLATQVIHEYAPPSGMVYVQRRCREGCESGAFRTIDVAGEDVPLFECVECSYPNADSDMDDVVIGESDSLRKFREMGLGE